MYMVMFILDDPMLLDDILDSWYAAGIHGATIFESTGIFRKRAKRLNIPIRYNITHASTNYEGNVTLLAMVSNEEMVKACLEATEKVVGDLSRPHTGIFTSWPLSVSKGLPKEMEGG
ncbi:MAG: hypothetical protein HY835_03080 [Anaerolineae bacterium]|nr:hypothetical protein [Anaerolineae bacterium]